MAESKPTLTEAQAQAILKNAPVVAMPVAKADSVMAGPPIPPRQALAGGLAGIVAWLICYFLGKYTGIVIPLELQTPIAIFVGGLVASIIPPSAKDIIKNLNDAIVHAAQKDPESNVSYVLKPVQPPAGEAATITPPAQKAV